MRITTALGKLTPGSDRSDCKQLNQYMQTYIYENRSNRILGYSLICIDVNGQCAKKI